MMIVRKMFSPEISVSPISLFPKEKKEVFLVNEWNIKTLF